MNFLFWTHASRGDIDNWGRLGNDGWSWDELEPYYTKSESYRNPDPKTETDLMTEYVRPDIHGTHGPVANTFPDGYGPLDKAWPRTYETLGLAIDGDPRDGLALGGYTNLINMDADHTRSYAATAYYVPVAKRSNLRVVTGAIVDKLLFDATNKPTIATDVVWTKGNSTFVTRATKEIVVSAGAFGSPTILERSGIGSRKALAQHNISAVVVNENVGENLQDHAYVPIGFAVNPGIPTVEDFYNETYFEEAFNQYLKDHTGPLATTGASSALLTLSQIGGPPHFLKTHGASCLSKGLMAQYDIILEGLKDEAVTQELSITGGMSPAFSNDTSKLFTVSEDGHFFSILGVLEHPFSRGSVHITSSDPTTYPILNPNYLSHPLDIQILSVIALHLQKVAKTAPLSDLLQGNGTVYQPGYVELTDENVQEWIRNNLQTEYHPVGTCPMLPKRLGGVVDSRFRVYGVENLRVVDASIFPIMPRANIQTLVYAIAERAADWILKDAGL